MVLKRRRYVFLGILVVVFAIGAYAAYNQSQKGSLQTSTTTTTSPSTMIDVYCTSDGCAQHSLPIGAGTLAQGCFRSLSDCTSSLPANSTANMTSTTTTSTTAAASNASATCTSSCTSLGYPGGTCRASCYNNLSEKQIPGGSDCDPSYQKCCCKS